MRAAALSALLEERFEARITEPVDGVFRSDKPLAFDFSENETRLHLEGIMPSDLAGELAISVRELLYLPPPEENAGPVIPDDTIEAPPDDEETPIPMVSQGIPINEAAIPTAEPAPPLTAELAVVEVLLEEMVENNDPWTYVNFIDERDIPMFVRQRFYQNFIAMVAQRPMAEQDALVNRGQQVFRFRSETARKDITELRSHGAAQTKISPSVLCDDFMAEMIYAPGGSPSVRYLAYYAADGHHEIQDSVQIGPTLYKPPQTALVEKGALLLPTGITEYESDKTLFETIAAYMDRWFCFAQQRWRDAATAYAMMTWVHERFPTVPYLRALGDWGSGKSRLLEVVGHVCCRPIFMSGATSVSSIFRALDRFRGTLTLDEADFSTSDLWAQLLKLLNVGYKAGGNVFRSEKDGTAAERFDERAFEVFGPKILTTREEFRDSALESRCLTYRSPTLGDVPHMSLDFNDEAKAEALALRNQLLLWRFRTYRAIAVDPLARIPGIEMRTQQVMRPIFAVVHDDDMRKDLLGLGQELGADSRERRAHQPEGRIVQALLDLEIEAQDAGYWKTSEVTTRANMGMDLRHHMLVSVVGQKLAGLLGARAEEFGHLKRRGFAFDAPKLQRLLRVYGIGRKKEPVR